MHSQTMVRWLLDHGWQVESHDDDEIVATRPRKNGTTRRTVYRRVLGTDSLCWRIMSGARR